MFPVLGQRKRKVPASYKLDLFRIVQGLWRHGQPETYAAGRRLPISTVIDTRRTDSVSILRALLENAVDAVGAHHGMALVVDRTRQLVVCRAVCRLPAQHIDSLFFKIGQGNTGKVAATGKPIRLNDDGGGGRGALLIVPVHAGDEVIAVLNLNGSSSRTGFTPADEQKVMGLVEEESPRLVRALTTEKSAGGALQLSQLISPGMLKEIQDACSRLLDVPCVFVDPHGRCLEPISSAPDLCVLMRSQPNAALRCELSMARAGAQAEDSGGSCLHECHAGVMTAVAPVLVRKQYVGSLVAMLRYQARDAHTVRTMAAELGLDPYVTLSRAAAFPTASTEQDITIRAFIQLVARMVSALAEENLIIQDEQLQIREKAEEVKVLRALAQQLGGLVELDLVLTEIVRRVIPMAGARAADIALMAAHGRLTIGAHRGLSADVVSLLEPALVDSPACRVVSSGAPCAVREVAAERSFGAWINVIRRQRGLHSAVSLPLGARERPVGALTIYFEEAPTDEILALLGAVADLASLAIQNALATEQARANEQSMRTFLDRMTRGVSSSLDAAQLVLWVADFAAEMMHTAYCVVYELVGDELQVRATSKAGRMVVEAPTLAVGEGLSGEVATSRRILRSPDVRRDPRFVTSAAAVPADAASYLGAPLIYKSDLLGVLAVYHSGHPYSEADLRLLGSFAGQAAIALHNARSYEHQHTIATTMQQSFLPPQRLRMDGLDVGPLYVPASDDVGGDYYDFLKAGKHRAVIVLGDVSGKGIKAATFTAMGKYILRAYAHEDPSPASVLNRMNSVMTAQVEPGTFITLFYALVDVEAMKLTYGSAGHPDGLLYSPGTGEFTHLSSTGMMVGAVPGEEYTFSDVNVRPGDILVIYTDGVIEARRGEELFGIDRMKAVIAANPELEARPLAEAIYDEVSRFHTSGMSDDVCVLVLRFLGLASERVNEWKSE